MVGLSRRWPATCIAAAAIGVLMALPASAPALITPPVTVAGPSSDVADFGGVAMASDGSGGVVYTKAVNGVRHVFANRYVHGSWSDPIRVDAEVPYEGSEPRIAAGRGGELLVVWVSEVATVKAKIRYGLYSARIGRGGSTFAPFELVDPDVRRGVGVDPAVAATATGQAIVAYRVITYNFDGTEASTAVQLRPGDVMAEFRVARLRDDRWARLGAVNNSLTISTRPPSEANGPKVGAGVNGGAVVAWQEPDQSGAARVYVRRIFGTTFGNVLLASPTTLNDAPVSGDVDAFSLATTPFNMARVAMRLLPNSAAGGVRLLLNTLPADFTVPSSQLLGAQQVFKSSSPQAASIGLPGVAADEKGGQQGKLRLAFVAGGQIQAMAAGGEGELNPLSVPAGPAPIGGAPAVASVDPDGGGTIAYPVLGSNGSPALAVRQEVGGKGAAQSGLLSGRQSGPIAGLRIAVSGAGDALIGWRQGEPGAYQVVVERVASAPASFKVKPPKGWVKPKDAKLRWEVAQSAVGRVRYAVMLDGRFVKRNLKRRQLRLPAGRLATGTSQVRVLAKDRLGQELLTRAVKLRVDGQPPVVALHGPRAGRLSVAVSDRDSGVAKGETWVDFGDGTSANKAVKFLHEYERAGRFTVTVRSRDRAGNLVRRSFEVRVG